MNSADNHRLTYRDVQRIRRRDHVNRLIVFGVITAGCLIVAAAALVSNLQGLP
jgi:putative flippase GtrA